ncbi:hypothetical protein C8R45DRAFT_1089047 [Mycena sanguinolenta]|nr:hypothetical protein C8R45DRAFT_1089047 [Mycena sanguinolenta]
MLTLPQSASAAVASASLGAAQASVASAAAVVTATTTFNPAVEASILPIASATSVSAAAARASVLAGLDPNTVFSSEEAGNLAFLNTKFQLEQAANDTGDAAQTQNEIDNFEDQLLSQF